MTVEELLQPRYKVIADWPGVAGKVIPGQILVLDDELDLFWCGGEPFTEDKLKDYPYLFKKLEWWEERDEKDMPEYAKTETEVYKIDQIKSYFSFYPNEFFPATEEEYNTQNK